MINLFIVILLLLPDFQIHGPGALSYTPVLEQVATRRIRNNWGLTGPLTGLLLATADCADLNKRGWLVAAGEVHQVTIVDCSQAKHRQAMKDNGILADVNEPELAHERGWLILED